MILSKSAAVQHRIPFKLIYLNCILRRKSGKIHVEYKLNSCRFDGVYVLAMTYDALTFIGRDNANHSQVNRIAIFKNQKKNEGQRSNDRVQLFRLSQLSQLTSSLSSSLYAMVIYLLLFSPLIMITLCETLSVCWRLGYSMALCFVCLFECCERCMCCIYNTCHALTSNHDRQFSADESPRCVPII